MAFALVEIELLQKGKEFRCKAVTGPFATPYDACVQVLGINSPLLVQLEADGWRGFRFNDTTYFIEEIYHPVETPEISSERLVPRYDNEEERPTRVDQEGNPVW